MHEHRPDNKAKQSLISKVQTRLMKSDFDLMDFMNLVVEQMMSLTPATGVVIELVDKDEMVYRAATGTMQDYIGLRIPMKGSLTGLCVTSREVLRSDDTETDERVNKEACRKVGARSMVVAPLFHQGKTIGVLKIISKFPDAFAGEDIKTLQLMAGFLADAIAKQMLREARDFI